MSRRDEYTEATRQALLSAGCEAFAREGYQAAGIEAISRAARVTRGAFYHHFEDKKALFDAVVVTLQAGAARKVETEARGHKKIWDRLDAGISAYLDGCLEPDYARIVIQDAPGVLGHRRYREIEDAYPMGLLVATLEALKKEGELAFEDTGLLSQMMDSMICRLAILLPDTKAPEELKKQGLTLIAGVLAPFRRK